MDTLTKRLKISLCFPFLCNKIVPVLKDQAMLRKDVSVQREVSMVAGVAARSSLPSLCRRLGSILAKLIHVCILYSFLCFSPIKQNQRKLRSEVEKGKSTLLSPLGVPLGLGRFYGIEEGDGEHFAITFTIIQIGSLEVMVERFGCARARVVRIVREEG